MSGRDGPVAHGPGPVTAGQDGPSRAFGRHGSTQLLEAGAPGAMLVIISGPSGVGKDTIIEALRRRPHDPDATTS